jgi:hypothetical protein
MKVKNVMRKLALYAGACIALAGIAAPASAQVRSVTVGIDTTCPYGLVA